MTRPETTRMRGDRESGLTTLEWLGVISIIITIVAFVPAFRGWLADAYDSVFRQIDGETGEVSAFSTAARGILITVVALLAFMGSGILVMYTNLGKRLAFLIAGAATFGWLVVGSMLFVVYAPRGLKPENLEGLNSFQIRVPAIAFTLASLILFLMFVAALDRYEKQADG